MKMNYIRELNAFRDWLMLNQLNTSGVALWYTLMSVNNMAAWKEWFTVPNSTLQQLAKLSKQGLADARSELKNKGLIDYKPGSKKQAGSYKMISLVKSFDLSLDQTLDQTVDLSLDQTLDLLDDQHLTINKHKQKHEKDIIPYAEIIDYLNDKTGSRYKASSQATQRHIRARWNDGYRLDDFKAVIDNKVRDWGSDPKMEPYLRPETLFGTKFESYLNQKRARQERRAPELPLVTVSPEEEEFLQSVYRKRVEASESARRVVRSLPG